MKKAISKDRMQKLLQKFHDEIVVSKEYTDLVASYTQAVRDGASPDVLLEQMFDFLDKECQNRLRQYMEKKDAKRLRRGLKREVQS
jgi:hypothetical protein